MSAEQTPDIETALTEAEVNALGPFIWGGWLGVEPEKHSDYAHELLELVGRIKADALAAAVREAKAEVLREAAHEYLNSGLVPNSQHRHYVSHWLRDRADRVAEPQHEAATSGKESEASDE